MRGGAKLLMVTRGRQGGSEARNNEQRRNGMNMGGYDVESNQGGQMRNEMRGGYGGMESNRGGQMELEMRRGPRSEMEMAGYEMENRFRDRQGREHYDNGRYAPMRNEMGMENRQQGRSQDGRYTAQGNANRWLPPYYDVEINRYEYEQEAPEDAMRGNYRNEMRGDGNSGRRGDTRMEMGGYGEMGQERMDNRRNPVGFAARFESPGSADASYQHMDEMAHRSGSKMEHGGAMSHKMPKFDERTAKEWVAKMENEDGTRGPHWTMDQTTKVMEQRGIKEDPAKFYAALNMMYSDYCEVAKKLSANNMDFFAEMAKAFLKDKDAGSQDKLAAYYEYVVKG